MTMVSSSSLRIATYNIANSNNNRKGKFVAACYNNYHYYCYHHYRISTNVVRRQFSSCLLLSFSSPGPLLQRSYQRRYLHNYYNYYHHSNDWRILSSLSLLHTKKSILPRFSIFCNASSNDCCSLRLRYHSTKSLTSNQLSSQQQQQQRRQQSSSKTNNNKIIDDESKVSGSIVKTQQKENLISIIQNLDIIEQIPIQDVRNFCFIAHVDHGKSSLSMRILELTGNLGIEAQQIAWNAAAAAAIEKSNNNSSILQRRNNNEENENEYNSNINNNNKDPIIVNSNASHKKEQINILDTLAVEQERGITVKTTTATMLYKHPSAIGPTGYLLLNLYDTPGHVDFGKEVTRTLQFVQGAILLLDSTQGIQAQTWSVYEKVKSLQPIHRQPHLLMALTKIDLPMARPIHVALSVSEFFHWHDPDNIIHTSARNRIGIQPLLDAICQYIPSPKPLPDDDIEYDNNNNNTKSGSSNNRILRAQVVDSWYDSRGVNCLVQIVSGQLKEGDKISIVIPQSIISGSNTDENKERNNNYSNQQQQSYQVQEVGILLPKAHRTGKLVRGQMGYVRFGLRDPRQAMPGTVLIWTTTIGNIKSMILPQIDASTHITKSVLYASVHPQDVDEFEDLCNAVDRLALNDTGLEVSKISSSSSSGGASNDAGSSGSGGPYLGPGIRVGFQGLLHVEVFRQRLRDEFNLDAVVTPPKVPYKIIIQPSKNNNFKEVYTKIVEDLSEWPDSATKYRVYEPIVDARIIARVEDAGSIMELINRRRGTELQTKPIDEEKWLFTAKIPWAEIVTDFHDQLKNVTSGFGSLDTSESDPPYAEANLSKVDIMLNGDIVESLSFVCHKDSAQGEGRTVCKKLHEVLPRQQFVTVIQAKADGKIVAAERIKAYRKDVLTKSGKTVGGGDQTRKMKLLEKQKKGKKRMQETGKVTLSQAAFNSVISRSS